LRRIETPELVDHLSNIAAKEHVSIEPAALALVARAAEGSVRDALSLLDQAIAHEEGGTIAADSVRSMLGLADRGRVLDLFEKVLSGRIAEALTDLNELYDRGADPLVIMQDLLETTHFLTRVKVAPGAEGFFDGGSGEARRAGEMAAKLSVPTLTRTWQMLLKGLFEVRDATRPIAAAEMALIRLAYAADLPPTEKLVRELLDNSNPPLGGRGQEPSSKSARQISGRGETSVSAIGPSPKMSSTFSTLPSAYAEASADTSTSTRRSLSEGGQGEGRALAVAPNANEVPAPTLRSLEDIEELAGVKGARQLRVNIANHMHLVRLEPGQIEFRPAANAPATLAGDLAQRLKEWTGTRWVVSVAREGGALTMAQQKNAAHAAKIEAVSQQPLVRAVLDRFPGAEIVAVREKEELDIAQAPDESSEA
jgi:DNA polymerase-3 subunit gamma/tau